MKNLASLLEALGIDPPSGARDQFIRDITCRSGEVGPDSLFVAIKGAKQDGHKYLLEALERKAAAAIVEERQALVALPQVVVPDSRRALAALSAAFYGYPAERLVMTGITGTNGKTSTSCMLDSILRAHTLQTGLIGTVSIRGGGLDLESSLTTPESRDLQQYLFTMKEKGVTHVTMEVSSSALELSRVHTIPFDVACFTNLSQEHTDLHGSFERYKEVKFSLIRGLAKGSFAVLNADVPPVKALAQETAAQSVLFSLSDPTADLYVRDLDLSSGRPTFTMVINQEGALALYDGFQGAFPVTLQVPGMHSVYNALCATAAALVLKVPVRTIRQALEAYQTVERRFEFIYEKDFKVFDDHFANPGNIEITLQTLSAVHRERLLIAYAIRGSRGVCVNRENAQLLASWLKRLGPSELIVTRSQDVVTEKDRVTPQEQAAFEEIMKQEGVSYRLLDTLEGAMEEVVERARPGDVVLLAGCQGMDAGARLFLEKLQLQVPYEERPGLMKPIENRVCGQPSQNC